MTSENWVKMRIMFGVLTLLAMGAFLWFVIPKHVAFHCGVIVTFDVFSPSNILCRIEYETESPNLNGCQELWIPAGKSEAACFLSLQTPLKKLRLVAPEGVRTGVIRLVGEYTVVRAADMAHLPHDLSLQPGWVPYWRKSE